ncbi:MAG: hypothetical protein ACO2O1_06655 [Candidatus Caldarchaeales archaeon]|jgi:hypothetical protein
MNKKKRDIVKEIEDRVNELFNLMVLDKTLQCDPADSSYTKCVLKKAMIHVELRKRTDKLFHQLAFEFVTTDSLDEKEAIESIVNHFIEVGLINEGRWHKMLNDALRFVNRLDGVEGRTRVRRIAESTNELFDEGLR